MTMLRISEDNSIERGYNLKLNDGDASPDWVTVSTASDGSFRWLEVQAQNIKGNPTATLRYNDGATIQTLSLTFTELAGILKIKRRRIGRHLQNFIKGWTASQREAAQRLGGLDESCSENDLVLAFYTGLGYIKGLYMLTRDGVLAPLGWQLTLNPNDYFGSAPLFRQGGDGSSFAQALLTYHDYFWQAWSGLFPEASGEIVSQEFKDASQSDWLAQAFTGKCREGPVNPSLDEIIEISGNQPALIEGPGESIQPNSSVYVVDGLGDLSSDCQDFEASSICIVQGADSACCPQDTEPPYLQEPGPINEDHIRQLVQEIIHQIPSCQSCNTDDFEHRLAALESTLTNQEPCQPCNTDHLEAQLRHLHNRVDDLEEEIAGCHQRDESDLVGRLDRIEKQVLTLAGIVERVATNLATRPHV